MPSSKSSTELQRLHQQILGLEMGRLEAFLRSDEEIAADNTMGYDEYRLQRRASQRVKHVA